LDVLGDGTRRKVFERLRKGPKSVSQIAKGLPVSRPAVSQHLAALKEAGLVTDRAEGTRRVYSVDLRALIELRAYFEDFWEESLQAFKTQAESNARSAR
jgi:DNA-binding transcriptional ArsR family regulator